VCSFRWETLTVGDGFSGGFEVQRAGFMMITDIDNFWLVLVQGLWVVLYSGVFLVSCSSSQ
jgi:hypothetical protein